MRYEIGSAGNNRYYLSYLQSRISYKKYVLTANSKGAYQTNHIQEFGYSNRCNHFYSRMNKKSLPSITFSRSTVTRLLILPTRFFDLTSVSTIETAVVVVGEELDGGGRAAELILVVEGAYS
jgi:hypothetical protein